MKIRLASLLPVGVTLAFASAASAQQDPPHHLVGIHSHDPHAITVALDLGIALDCQSRHEATCPPARARPSRGPGGPEFIWVRSRSYTYGRKKHGRPRIASVHGRETHN